MFKSSSRARGFRAVAAASVLSLGLSGIALAAQPTIVDLVRTGKRDSVLAAITSPDVDVNVKSPDGATSLMWALANSDIELARALLKAGAKVNVISKYGASALSEAIKLNDLAMVRTLLDGGADVNSPNLDGQTALMLAISGNSADIAKLLIERGADINAIETFRGQNALMWAAAGNMPDIVDLLIAKGANNINMRAKSDDWDRMVTSEPRAQFGTRQTGGLTALLYATRSGCLRCAQALVKAGADIEKPNPDGVTPLINALDNAKFDVAMFLLDQGADPNRWDMSGRTPLYAAVDRKGTGAGAAGPGGPGGGGRGGPGAAAGRGGPGAGGPPGAAGGPPGAGGFGGPGGPGAGAARAPAGPTVTGMDVVNRLLGMGVDVNHQLTRKRPYGQGRGRFQDYDWRGGVGPLFLAAYNNDHEAMEALIKHGAEVDLPNVFQMTPLMVAAGMRGTGGGGGGGGGGPAGGGDRAYKSLDILLAAGANINAQITDSHTHTAVLMAYVAGRDQEGRTALMANAETGNDRMVKYLLDHGADPTLKDAKGVTALDLARLPPDEKATDAVKTRTIAARAAAAKVLEAALTSRGIAVPPAAAPVAAAPAAPPTAAN